VSDQFHLTEKQAEARDLLAGPQTHTLLVGGSRSGKTFLICYAIVIRALGAPGSRHLIARFRFNHVISSIWHDTLPKVMRLAFPQVPYKTDKSAWFIKLPNESEIWFGGLDEKERTEKVLGQEYATIFLNEVSQISWSAVETVRTRLAQNCGLRLKLIYDCNPPLATHWTNRLFVQKRSPEPPYKPLNTPEQYAWLRVNPGDNADNLPAETMRELENLGPRAKQRFLLGEWGSATENALWDYEVIERHRVKDHPDLQRVIIGVDPSGTKGEDDERSDHVGIVAVGLGTDGRAYVLEDLTCKAPPAVWGRQAVHAYERHAADCIVGEVNYGGAMVEHVVRSAASKEGINISYREVHASRGKVIRAEPISTLYEQGKVSHVGTFPELEDQLCAFTTQGYMGDRSPDRGDALIWALSDLFMGMTRKAKRDWGGLQAGTDFDPLAW
jgi:predicted phage terminase large subunit-like protein